MLAKDPACAVVQIGDETAVAHEACCICPCRSRHDGQRSLPGQAIVGKCIPHTVCLVDGQVFLRLLEFLEEPVLKDIDLVGVRDDPLVHAAVAEIPDFEHVARAQCPLNAEVPRHHVGLADVLVQAVYP